MDPSSPYRAPVHAGGEPSLSADPAKTRFWKRAFRVSIVMVVVPPMFGLVGTVVGMIRAFGDLKTSGAADPSALAGDISIALLTTVWGLVFSLMGIILLIISIVRLRACRKDETSLNP